MWLLIFKEVFWPCGLAEGDGAGCSAGVSVSGAYPGLTKTRSCTAADKLVISDPDQSHYQFWSRPKPLWLCRCGPMWPDACLSAPHTDAALFDGLEGCVRVWCLLLDNTRGKCELCNKRHEAPFALCRFILLPKHIICSTKATYSVAISFIFFTRTQNMFMHTHFHHILSLSKLEPWRFLSIAQINQEHKIMIIQPHNEMIINNRQHFSWFPKCKFVFDQLNLMKSSAHHRSCGVILISLILFVHAISEKFEKGQSNASWRMVSQ